MSKAGNEKEQKISKSRWLERLKNKVIEEFKDGFVKLIGWTLPVFIFVLIFNIVGDHAWNNSLQINEIEFSKTNNMVLSEDNLSRYKEFSSDDSGETVSYSYEARFKKGHGKMESAAVFYSYKEEDRMIPVSIEVSGNSFSRIFRVSPSTIDYQITYYKEKSGESKYKRAYLVLKDDETKNTQIFLLLIDRKNGKVIEDYDESEFLGIAPMDQDIENVDDPKLELALNREKINDEIIYIRSFY